MRNQFLTVLLAFASYGNAQSIKHATHMVPSGKAGASSRRTSPPAKP